MIMNKNNKNFNSVNFFPIALFFHIDQKIYDYTSSIKLLKLKLARVKNKNNKRLKKQKLTVFSFKKKILFNKSYVNYRVLILKNNPINLFLNRIRFLIFLRYIKHMLICISHYILGIIKKKFYIHYYLHELLIIKKKLLGRPPKALIRIIKLFLKFSFRFIFNHFIQFNLKYFLKRIFKKFPVYYIDQLKFFKNTFFMKKLFSKYQKHMLVKYIRFKSKKRNFAKTFICFKRPKKLKRKKLLIKKSINKQNTKVIKKLMKILHKNKKFNLN